MREVGRLERIEASGPHACDGPAGSSYHPLHPLDGLSTNTSSPSQDTELAQNDTSAWLPCHYFDYMAGTSTGGLISIMLGRLRMNIDDCISDYEDLGSKVFGYSRWIHCRSLLLWPREKYDCRVLENVVNEVVHKRVSKAANFPGGTAFAFDEQRCRV